MNAEIKRVHSPDVFDLKSYIPEEPDCFCFLLQVMIGPQGEEGEESFDIQVCTPKWLIQKYKREDVIIGRNYLLVFEYDYDRIMNVIKKFCDGCKGDNWREVAIKLSRLGEWEFENYSPKIKSLTRKSS